MNPVSPVALTCLALSSALILSGCGGAGSSAPAVSLSLSGAAATGAALVGADIRIKCAGAGGTARSDAQGRFSVSISGATLPCVLRATSSDGALVLHSLLEDGAATAQTANITPMTELVVAKAQGSDAATLFDQFETERGKLSPVAVETAKAKVREALASIVDLSGVDPVKDLLVPAVAGRGGNGLDQKLDVLRDRLAEAGMKVTELGAVVTASGDDNVAEVVSSTVRPRSQACRGLRSGPYRVVLAGAVASVQHLEMDAARMQISSEAGSEVLSGAGCTLATASGQQWVVGTQGIGIVRGKSDSLGLLMPRQSLALKDLAGTWSWMRRKGGSATTSTTVSGNLLGEVSLSSGALSATALATVQWGEFKLGKDGVMSGGTRCDPSGCKAMSAAELVSLSKAADGGFSTGGAERWYAAKAGSGAALLVAIAPAATGLSGDLMVARRGSASEMPALSERYRFAELGIQAKGTVDTAFREDSIQIVAADKAGKRYVERRLSDCRAETWRLGLPLSRMVSRDSGTSASCSDSSNSALTVPAALALSARGLGVSAFVLPTAQGFGLTVRAAFEGGHNESDDKSSED